MRRKVEIAMRRKGTVRKAVLCVAVAVAMFVGTAIPRVYATNHLPSGTAVGTQVDEGDVLEFPNGATNQGMQIRYLDESNNVLAEVNTEKNYTIPEYNSLRMKNDSQLQVGEKFAYWEVSEVPAEGGNPLQWTLVRHLDSGGANEINLIGSYDLEAGTTYTLNGGLNHVKGDNTTYASGISFTVGTNTTCTFEKISN